MATANIPYTPPSNKTPGLSARAWLILLVAVGVVLLIGSPSGKINWNHDFVSAVDAANARGVPLLVDFYANWCGPCQALEAEVFSSDLVSQTAEASYVTVRVDLSNNSTNTPERKIATRFNVRGIPALLIIDPANQAIIARASPADLTEKGMIAFLNRHAPTSPSE